jgi:hypothetical protein
MSMLIRITASVTALFFASVQATGRYRSPPIITVRTIAALIGVAACTGSPTSLRLQPDFTMVASEGLTSVSVRNALPGMADDEFAQIVRTGMQLAAPGAVLSDPVHAPFPQFRIVWHVNPNGPRGSASKLFVNIFENSTPLAYEVAVLDNCAAAGAITHAIESMTRRLMASQTSRAATPA